jgi:hypothetical protein
MRKTKMKNKKMASEFAVGITLLMAIIIGGLVWMQNKKLELLYADDSQVTIPAQRTQKQQDVRNGNDLAVADSSELTEKFQKNPCKGHLYEGESTIKGTYVQGTTYGDQKEWLFKVTQEDRKKLPIQIKMGNGNDVNELLKIEDITPELAAKLKQATNENPEPITIKGYYLHCEGGPIVSIAPAKVALSKYFSN